MRDTNALSKNNFNSFQSKLESCNTEGDCGFNNTVPTTNNSFISKCNQINDCKLYINNGSYNNTVSGEESGFTREIWMDDTIDSGKDEVIIFSKVKWTQGSGEYDVTLSENLFDWIE